MAIDEGLLRQARDAAARMADAQRQADLAKADYHHAVRRLHFAGASMREVAEALELSHQRVHQIIEATGGTGGWKSRGRAERKAEAARGCSFCGLADAEVAKLVAGPGVFICDECVGLVRRVVDSAAAVETPRTRIDPVAGGSALRCSFCGKAAGKVSSLVAGPGLCICGECVQLCEEVLAAAAGQ